MTEVPGQYEALVQVDKELLRPVAPPPFKPTVETVAAFQSRESLVHVDTLKIGHKLAITTFSGSRYEFECMGGGEFRFIAGKSAQHLLGKKGTFNDYYSVKPQPPEVPERTKGFYPSVFLKSLFVPPLPPEPVTPVQKIGLQLAALSPNSSIAFCPTDPDLDALLMSRMKSGTVTPALFAEFPGTAGVEAGGDSFSQPADPETTRKLFAVLDGLAPGDEINLDPTVDFERAGGAQANEGDLTEQLVLTPFGEDPLSVAIRTHEILAAAEEAEASLPRLRQKVQEQAALASTVPVVLIERERCNVQALAGTVVGHGHQASSGLKNQEV